MEIKLLSGKVMIKPDKLAEKTKSGVFIATTKHSLYMRNIYSQQGEVVVVGPGELLSSGAVVPVEVKVGDQVLFERFGAMEVEFDDQKYLVLPQRDIKMVIGGIDASGD